MKVLGIDLSTTTAIGFCQLSLYELSGVSIDLGRYKSHKVRRRIVRYYLSQFDPDFVILEKVRLFHKGFINVDVIKRLGGLTYLIIDSFDCPIYEIDVRSWKSVILGKANSDKNLAINYVYKKYGVWTNDNLADAICIAECGLRGLGKLREAN